MALNLPPHFNLNTFTLREENPIGVRVSDLREDARQAILALNNPDAASYADLLLSTLDALCENLGDEPRNPDDLMGAGLFDAALAIAFQKTGETPVTELELDIARTIVELIAARISQYIFEDILGEDLRQRLNRMEEQEDPDVTALLRSNEVLQENIRREYGFP